MVLSLYFPAAVKVVEALQPLHASAPSKVKRVAEILEETLQAYGRSLIATEKRDEHEATRAAESYKIWRTRLATALQEVEVEEGGAHEAAIKRASKAARDLAFTSDKVLNKLNVQCSIVASGVEM